MTALELVSQTKVIPVLRGSNPEAAVELAKVLHEEGFQTLEVTFTVPGALDVIRELCRLEDAIVGARTVLDTAQLEAAVEAGAQFLVSPGLEPKLLETARHSPIPFLPGVFTASEVMQARAVQAALLGLSTPEDQ
jgi:2-dehydro-3-deoxyphosphogluconate aldolase/(4S)-4-hydroxy-2-oxoglutarate aldolase